MKTIQEIQERINFLNDLCVNAAQSGDVNATADAISQVMPEFNELNRQLEEVRKSTNN